MSWLRRNLVIVVTVGLLASALVVATVTDRTVAEPVTPPGFGVGPVAAGTPRTEGWGAVAGVRPGVDPGSPSACERGELACLDVVITEMEARLAELGCDHTAPFAFTYLEMTRGVRQRVAEPGFFVAPAGTANMDAVFARFYFDAIDNWRAGRVGEVPGAWQLAFGAADGGRTSAAADLLLGMNAHISRDLAYVVALLIDAEPTVARDHADYDTINKVLGEVKGPMLKGSAERFDSQLALLDLPLPAAAASTSIDLIAEWRSRAFADGRRLALAPPAERAAIAAEIDRLAVANAVLILNADGVSATVSSRTERDSYCRARAAG